MTNAQQDRSPQVLTYARRAPWYSRRRFRRTVWIVGGLVVAVWSYFYLPESWRYAQLWYYQRQCIQLQMPPTQVVYDDDPAATIPAGADPRDYHWEAISPKRKALVYDPICWKRCCQLRSSSVSDCPVIMLKQVHLKKEMLVALSMTPCEDMGGIFGTSFKSMEVGTRANNDGLEVTLMDVGPKEEWLSKGHLRIFAAQSDPSDPLHFVARYELGNSSGELGIYLKPNDFHDADFATGPLHSR